MKVSHPSDVLVRPVLTEESTIQSEAHNKFVFRVDPRANKNEIREAVESLFDVRVTKVRTLQQPSKRRTRGRSAGRIPRWKKAYVRLHEGDEIEIFEG